MRKSRHNASLNAHMVGYLTIKTLAGLELCQSAEQLQPELLQQAESDLSLAKLWLGNTLHRAVTPFTSS